MIEGTDRRRVLASIPDLNGIDYVDYVDGHVVLHFQTAVALAGKIRSARITGGWPFETTRILPVRPEAWAQDSTGRPLLRLRLEPPGDFSTYRIELEGASLDSHFSRTPFTFETRTPRTVDCERPDDVRAPGSEALPPIDYLAKDFTSFRQVLSDFSAQRYPAWRERSEADFGVMFMEALCSLADDLSYQQDRVAAEAYLDTASQRLSVVRHARLVDYAPRPATAARVWLQFNVDHGPIPSGLGVSGQRPDGSSVRFETGTGVFDESMYEAHRAWNRLDPYWWDEGERILLVGATRMWVRGDRLGLHAGVRLLLDTSSRADGTSIRQIVRLTEAFEEEDVVFGQRVTQLRWSHDDALTDAHDLGLTVIRGNIVPATEGRRFAETFGIGTNAPGLPQAIVRTGPNATPQFLYTPLQQPIAWLCPEGPGLPAPEIKLTRRRSSAPQGGADDGESWAWAPWLLDAGPSDHAFTLDPGTYAAVSDAGSPAGSGSTDSSAVAPMDYAGDPGETIRFGDGVYGALPETPSTFDLVYRAGGGAAGNVPPGTLTAVDLSAAAGTLVNSVTNPLAATGGADAESLDSVRSFAPDAIASSPRPLLTPGDYAAKAKAFPWVATAKTRLRHTGSWLSMMTYVAADDTHLPSDERLRAVADCFERGAMAGREAFVFPPRYVALDLAITVQAKPRTSRIAIKRALASALSSVVVPGGAAGFFRVGQFGLGDPLKRAALEAVVLAVPGVDWVIHVLFRRRGGTAGYEELPASLAVASDEIIRVDGDPTRPDAGSIRIDIEGGQ